MATSIPKPTLVLMIMSLLCLLFDTNYLSASQVAEVAAKKLPTVGTNHVEESKDHQYFGSQGWGWWGGWGGYYPPRGGYYPPTKEVNRDYYRRRYRSGYRGSYGTYGYGHRGEYIPPQTQDKKTKN